MGNIQRWAEEKESMINEVMNLLDAEATIPEIGADQQVGRASPQDVRLEALYDWEAQSQDELSFVYGETLYLLEQTEVGWWKGKARLRDSTERERHSGHDSLQLCGADSSRATLHRLRPARVCGRAPAGAGCSLALGLLCVPGLPAKLSRRGVL